MNRIYYFSIDHLVRNKDKKKLGTGDSALTFTFNKHFYYINQLEQLVKYKVQQIHTI